MVMGLFGGGGGSKFDAGAQRAILEQGLKRKRGVLEQGFQQLPGVSQKFEQKATGLGEGFQAGALQRGKEFGTQLQGVESPELVRAQQGKAQELAFRNLPAAQQMIKENLAATGGLGRGAAIKALQAPVLQATQQAGDMGFQIQQQAAARGVGRQEEAIRNMFQTGQGAALEKLGIDENVARTLMQTGRGDILQRAQALAGIEEQRTQGLLDIESQRQMAEMARDKAKRGQRAALLGTLGSLGGAAIGGPLLGKGALGALIGSQVGGGLGSLAGGGQTPMDLSSTLAILAAKGKKVAAPTSTAQ